MPEISVPVLDLRMVAGQFQRVSGNLLDAQAALARALSLLDGKSRQQVCSDEQLAQVTAQSRQVAEGAQALARTLQIMLDAFEELDRQGAASIPTLPQPSFPLPLPAPPRRPWPYASAPVSTTIRPLPQPTPPAD